MRHLMPSSRRDLRLASGLVLFAYVTLHLGCHALGLVSLDAAEAGLRATVRLWHSRPGTLLLYGAAALHVGLALLAIYERRTLRMAPLNGVRIALGLAMPLSLIGHFVATRYAFERFGLAAEYSRVAANLWTAGASGLALGLLAPGWVHGCLGLRFAFGHRRLWQRLRLGLFGAALLLPVLAGLGFVTMGRELVRPYSTAGQPAGPGAARQAALADMYTTVLAAYLGCIALVAVARTLRSLDERRRRAVVRIAYPGRSVAVPRGWSVLEASRSFGIGHQATCGGRARCSTCRVRIVDGLAHCPAPNVDEQRMLDRIDVPDAVRLACQLRPTGDIAVEPLLQVEQSRWSAAPPRQPTTEREVAVLFFDLRVRTVAARGDASAHDTIHALDRFHAIVGAAIEAGGGMTCRQAGDHSMALFGLDGDLRPSCRRALAAARRIERQAAAACLRLSQELALHADFAVGVHVGAVVAGMIGDGGTRTLSAVGEAIDATARLQAFAARRGAKLVISRRAAQAAGIDADPALDWQPADTTAADAMPMPCADASATVGAVSRRR